MSELFSLIVLFVYFPLKTLSNVPRYMALHQMKYRGIENFCVIMFTRDRFYFLEEGTIDSTSSLLRLPPSNRKL